MTITTLKLEGRLDTAAVARAEVTFAARAGALTKPGDKAIIDLYDLTYISSLGIRLLVGTLKQFRQRGVAFATIGPRDAMARNILQLADLTDHLNMVDRAAAARAALGEIS